MTTLTSKVKAENPFANGSAKKSKLLRLIIVSRKALAGIVEIVEIVEIAEDAAAEAGASSEALTVEIANVDVVAANLEENTVAVAGIAEAQDVLAGVEASIPLMNLPSLSSVLR